MRACSAIITGRGTDHMPTTVRGGRPSAARTRAQYLAYASTSAWNCEYDIDDHSDTSSDSGESRFGTLNAGREGYCADTCSSTVRCVLNMVVTERERRI